MTRYMLDAIPDGAEASDGDVTTASDGSASAADNIANPDVPVAADTPAVVPANDQGQAEKTPAGSLEAPASPSDTSAELVDAAAATSAISTPESSPTADIASSVSPVSLTMILHPTLAYIASPGHTFCRCLRQHTRASQRCQPRHGPWRLERLGRLCARHHPIRALIHPYASRTHTLSLLRYSVFVLLPVPPLLYAFQNILRNVRWAHVRAPRYEHSYGTILPIPLVAGSVTVPPLPRCLDSPRLRPV